MLTKIGKSILRISILLIISLVLILVPVYFIFFKATSREPEGLTLNDVRFAIEDLTGVKVLYSSYKRSNRNWVMDLNGVEIDNPVIFKEKVMAKIPNLVICPKISKPGEKPSAKVHLDKVAIYIDKLNIVINESGESNISMIKVLQEYKEFVVPRKGTKYYDEKINEIAILKQEFVNRPEDVGTLARIGDLYMKLRDYDSALRYYKEASVIKPDNLLLKNKLASNYFLKGNPKKEIEKYERIVHLRPEDYNAKKVLMQYYGWYGDYDKAIEMAKILLARNSYDMEVWEGLADYYALSGKTDSAANALEKLKPSKGSDIVFRKRLAEYYSWVGKHKDAVIEYEEVLRKDPLDAEVYKKLADLYTILEMPERAIELEAKYKLLQNQETNFMIDKVVLDIGGISYDNKMEGWANDDILKGKKLRANFEKVKSPEEIFYNIVVFLAEQPSLQDAPLVIDVETIKAESLKNK